MGLLGAAGRECWQLWSDSYGNETELRHMNNLYGRELHGLRMLPVMANYLIAGSLGPVIRLIHSAPYGGLSP